MCFPNILVKKTNGHLPGDINIIVTWHQHPWLRDQASVATSSEEVARRCQESSTELPILCPWVKSNSSHHKTNEYLNSAEQIHRNWYADQLSELISSWDITWWCSINLLWKELMERTSEHTGLIISYQLFITAACTNTGGKMKDSRHRTVDRCPFVLRHSLSQVTSFMQLGMSCKWLF